MTITFTKVKVISSHCGVVTRPQAVIPQGGHRCFSSNESHKITVRETIKMVSLENLIFQTYHRKSDYQIYELHRTAA
ncbi:MAG: hypothetical protein J6I50_10800 [Clostridia bacterium]|nr:hypothetical protein [Clostridia bacterium]